MITIQVPEKANFILETLENAGFEAYVVGGCVRDSILGRNPYDWDITTSAKPEQVKELFRRTVDTGLQHGTVTVMQGAEGFEVTTYRIDGAYEDGRHPTEVVFTPDLKEDLLRRDFTINAMAYNPRHGLVDLFDGLGDIERKTIRCVGKAEERFGEDALRMLRAVRFSAQLGYEISENTLDGIRKLAPTLEKVSAERIQIELVKLLVSDHPEVIRIAYETGMTKVFLPEFDLAMQTNQNHPHHCYSVGEHLIHSIMEVKPEKELRLAMLLHDIGKPQTITTDEKGINHFYRHPIVSAQMAHDILKRLKFDNHTLDVVERLVRFHDINNGVTPTPKLVRKTVNKIGPDIVSLYQEVRLADVMSQSTYLREEKLAALKLFTEIYEEITAAGDPVTLKQLAVNGRDLMAAGIPAGPGIGEILGRLLDEVLEDPKRNDREYLLKRAESLKEK